MWHIWKQIYIYLILTYICQLLKCIYLVWIIFIYFKIVEQRLILIFFFKENSKFWGTKWKNVSPFVFLGKDTIWLITLDLNNIFALYNVSQIEDICIHLDHPSNRWTLLAGRPNTSLLLITSVCTTSAWEIYILLEAMQRSSHRKNISADCHGNPSYTIDSFV